MHYIGVIQGLYSLISHQTPVSLALEDLDCLLVGSEGCKPQLRMNQKLENRPALQVQADCS